MKKSDLTLYTKRLRDSYGYVVVKDDKIYISLANDFGLYYKWFIDRSEKVQTSFNAFKPHISLWRKKIHGDLKNPSKAKQLNGRKVRFTYDTNVKIGGFSKGFRNFWVDCYSGDFSYIENFCGFKQGRNFRGYHVTICNYGKNGAEIKKFQPKMIELR